MVVELGNMFGDIGHKGAIHHIHVEPIRSGDPADVALQVYKISRKDRGGNFYHFLTLLSHIGEK